MTWPWEQLPATVPEPSAPVPVEDTVRLLQRDLAYMVTHTAVRVHSNRPELQATVNTPRGQVVLHGECKFSDGTTVEFHDIGMPQPGVPTMSVRDLVAETLAAAGRLGLELQP